MIKTWIAYGFRVPEATPSTTLPSCLFSGYRDAMLELPHIAGNPKTYLLRDSVEKPLGGALKKVGFVRHIVSYN